MNGTNRLNSAKASSLLESVPVTSRRTEGPGVDVTVVIPTLNAERYVRDSIASINVQTGVTFEIIVVDGGSRDETVSIARSFEAESVRVFVEPGMRQAAATNFGVREANAPTVLVLSADDVLYPEALAKLFRELEAYPNAEVAYAEADFIDANGALVGHYPTGEYDAGRFEAGCFVPHAAAIVRRDAFKAVGELDESLEYALDFDFWVRMSRRHAFRKIDACVVAIRMHAATKTLGGRGPAYREAFVIFKRYFAYIPYPWIFAYVNYLLDHGDQFFDPLKKKHRSMLLALPLGCILNFPRVGRYARDWLAARKIGAFLHER